MRETPRVMIGELICKLLRGHWVNRRYLEDKPLLEICRICYDIVILEQPNA